METSGKVNFAFHEKSLNWIQIKRTNRPAVCPFLLPDLDSNQDKQNQNLLCYRYTIRQF